MVGVRAIWRIGGTTSTGRASFDRFAVPRWMVSADRAEISPRCGSFWTARSM